MRTLPCTLIAVLLLASSLSAQSVSKPADEKPAPLVVSILNPPSAFRGDGQWHLCYEIYVTNLSQYSWTVQSIEANGDSGKALLTVTGEDLASVLFHPGWPQDFKTGVAAQIAPGEAVVAYLWIDIPQGAVVPTHLQHKFTLKMEGKEGTFAIAAPTTAVADQLPEIASPLRGKNWQAANGPSNTSQHRRALIVLDGSPHIAQRYAIDWVQVGADSKTFRGDPKDNRSYHCFGVEAHAISSGTVVEIKDGIPENTPGAKPVVPITLETVAGNHVNLDLGGGVYAMYAHLQPGSIRVKLGDRVTTGQVIGLVGNTGNSSEPHLHFQLMNRNSPLGSNGIPYTLASYKLLGKMGGSEETPKVELLSAPTMQQKEIPMEDEVVDFEQ